MDKTQAFSSFLPSAYSSSYPPINTRPSNLSERSLKEWKTIFTRYFACRQKPCGRR